MSSVKDTYAKAYNDFSHFIASNPTQKDIEAKALKNGYNLQERKDLFNNEHYVGGVSNTREAMRWIFNEDTEIGNVSPLYECGENDHACGHPYRYTQGRLPHDGGYERISHARSHQGQKSRDAERETGSDEEHSRRHESTKVL